MKKYFKYIESNSTHERRRHAMQVASVFTVIAFVGWITTLGLRFASLSPGSQKTADSSYSADSQLASIVSSGSDAAATSGVEVATTSVYSMTDSGQ